MSVAHGGLIIGLGHPDRGDDAVGLLAAEQLATWPPPGWRVATSTTGLLGALSAGAWSRLVVLDGLVTGAPPGTLHRIVLKAGAAALSPTVGAVSTHGISLVDEVALGRELALLPADVVVLGIEIEARNTAMGAGISEAVARGVDALVSAARHEAMATGTRPTSWSLSTRELAGFSPASSSQDADELPDPWHDTHQQRDSDEVVHGARA